MAKEKKDFDTVTREILEIVKGPVSLEVVSENAEGMISEGKKLAQLAENVVIKVPLTTEGLKATRALSDQGIGVNQTLIFSPVQALLAAKAGARYVSPFIGRLDDISQTGMDLVEQILTAPSCYFVYEVIVASIRHPVRSPGGAPRE